jgi:hypothetical protein
MRGRRFGWWLGGMLVATVATAAAEPAACPLHADEPCTSATAGTAAVAGGAAAAAGVANADDAAPDAVATVPVDTETKDGNWIDAIQTGVHRGVEGAGNWIDGFFADKEPAETGKPTLGRLAIGGYWDERDQFDPSFRMRARVPFENLRNRVSLLFGRSTEREVVEGRPRAGTDTLPNRFSDVEDDSWLLGLGFNRSGDLTRGLQLDAGIRLSSDPDPLARATYRWNVEVSERTLFRPAQTAFWRRSRGFGTTTNLMVDHLISSRFLFRTAVAGTIAEDTDGIEWQSYATLYQDLPGRSSLGWSIVAAGETSAPVELQNYGFQLRFRRRILRDWLFLELLQSITWPRDLVTEPRDRNLGFGVGLEMYFGPVPDNQLR